MEYIDPCVYRAANYPAQQVDSSKLQGNLSRFTAGGRNTRLHLASAAGNLQFIRQIGGLDPQPAFIEAVNVNGDTALHEAAQRGHYEVVEELVSKHSSLVNMHNNRNQTALFKACEGGHTRIAKKLLKDSPSKLFDRSLDGRTCLHVAVSRGDAGSAYLLNCLLCYIEHDLGHEKKNLLQATDRQGNTVLHIAARRNRQDIVTRLLEFEPHLSYSLNNEKETAVCIAVKLGFLPVVEALVNCSPDSIEIASKNGKTILHLAAELNQVKILKFLVENVVLSQIINQLDDTQAQDDGNQSGRDTALHIAARNKNDHVVDLLLRVSGVNRDDVNSAGLTPLDIAKENTEYYEPDKIIEMLSTYPRRHKPFLYSAPTMSREKQKKAEAMLDNIFADRRNIELVVAVLLATMAFTAVFTLPGGFQTDTTEESLNVTKTTSKGSNVTETTEKGSPVVGMPVLIGFDSFKLFLVFDCLAFFLALFVVLLWEMSTPFIARDKTLFIIITHIVVSVAFFFMALGLIAAVYAVLAQRVKMFAAIVLGTSIILVLFGCGVFLYLGTTLSVRRARFHNLCGFPCSLDNFVVKCWLPAERYGIMDVGRWFDDVFHRIVTGMKARREKRPICNCCGNKSLSTCLSSLDP